VSVDEGISEFEHGFVAYGFVVFALLVGDGFFYDLLLVEVSGYWGEITFGEGSYAVFFVEDGFEVGEEVFGEDGGGFGIA